MATSLSRERMIGPQGGQKVKEGFTSFLVIPAPLAANDFPEDLLSLLWGH